MRKASKFKLKGCYHLDGRNGILFFPLSLLNKERIDISPYPWHEDRQIHYYQGISIDQKEVTICGRSFIVPHIRECRVSTTTLENGKLGTATFDESLLNQINGNPHDLYDNEFYLD